MVAASRAKAGTRHPRIDGDVRESAQSARRRTYGNRTHGRSGAAADAQRQDDRTRQVDAIARHLVEHEVLDLVDAVLRQVIVVHAEREIGQRVGRKRRCAPGR